MALVHLDPAVNRLLTPEGRPLFVLGTNYEGYFDRAWKMWDAAWFDPALIELDFRKAQQSGFNSIRLFIKQPLTSEIAAGNFAKLDLVLDLARRCGQYILLTFNDDHSSNLASVGQLDAKIARRYRDNPILLGYDLENEPSVYTILVARYPAGYPAPLLTSLLVDHYGERVTHEQAAAQHQDYYYANGMALFREYVRDVGQWIRNHGGTVLDYMVSPDSAPWQVLIGAMSDTLASWIAAQRDPIRSADPQHLITVGYNWIYVAGLTANRVLDFHQIHLYQPQSFWGLRATFVILDGMRRRFRNQPILIGEFGYSNQTSSNPAASQPVDPNLTAVYEAAVFCHLRANGFAGGYKWMLNDVRTTANPREASFGVFADGDRPKPIRDVVARLAAVWSASDESGAVAVQPDSIVGAGYVYRAPNALFLAGTNQQDPAAAWQAAAASQACITWSANEFNVTTTGAGTLSLDPVQLIPDWDTSHRAVLYRLQNGQQVQVATFPAGASTMWATQSGVVYRLISEAAVVVPTVWYFAEGATHPGFEMWLALMNPLPQPVEAMLTFMRRDGSIITRSSTVSATSRTSLRVNDFLPGLDLASRIEARGPLYAERTTYFGHDGHSVMGIAAPSRTWHFADGSTRPGFDTWILLQNSGTIGTVTYLTFFKDDGTRAAHVIALPPLSRQSIFVNQVVPNAAFAALVQADQPIVAELAMYYGSGGGHAVAGVAAPATAWHFPSIETRAGFDTSIVLLNPNGAAANVRLRFLAEDGSTIAQQVQVPAQARLTVPANAVVPNTACSALVSADQPIVVERITYFANGRGGHATTGASAPARTWQFPEGSTQNTETFVVMMNPENNPARVVLTFLTADRATLTHAETVAPTSRLTIPVASLLPNARFSTQLTSDRPVVAERVTYLGGGQGGTAVVGIAVYR